MSIEAIHQLLSDWGMPRLSPVDRVYDLRKHSWVPLVGHRLLHQRQTEILQIMRSSPWPLFLNFVESPQDWELAGHWHAAAEDTWIVPSDGDSDELLGGFLSQGEWAMYLADSPNSFAMTAEEIAEFIKGNGIPVFVQAFFDNADWRIALQTDADPIASVA